MKQRTQTGFTLIELMVALTVVGILCAFAVPSFRQYTRDTRASAAHNDLVTAFGLARSEALRRGTPIGICGSSDGETCDGSDDWSKGWVVYTDATGAANDLDGADKVLQIWGAQQGELTVEGLSGLESVRYQSTGMLDAASPLKLEVFVPGCTGERKREIEITIGGSVSTTKKSC